MCLPFSFPALPWNTCWTREHVPHPSSHTFLHIGSSPQSSLLLEVQLSLRFCLRFSCCCSVGQSYLTACLAYLSLAIFRSLHKFKSIEIFLIVIKDIHIQYLLATFYIYTTNIYLQSSYYNTRSKIIYALCVYTLHIYYINYIFIYTIWLYN